MQSQVRTFLNRNIGSVSIFVVALILFVYFAVTTDAFFTAPNLVNILRQTAPTIIMAMAMTFVITTGEIDLSVGSILALAASAMALIAQTHGAFISLAAALAIGLVVGLLNGALAAYAKMPTFIVTLAALTAVRGIALLITQGYSTPVTDPVLVAIGQGTFLGLYTPTWIALVAVIVAWYVFNRTRYGRYVVALGSNAESLRRSGVDTKRLLMVVMTVAGVTAALAGVVTAARLGSGSSNSGDGFELEAITAVVLGGTRLSGGKGSIIGTLIGALTLGIISNGLVLAHVDVYWVPIVQGTILIVAIFLNSTLFKRMIGGRK